MARIGDAGVTFFLSLFFCQSISSSPGDVCFRRGRGLTEKEGQKNLIARRSPSKANPCRGRQESGRPRRRPACRRFSRQVRWLPPAANKESYAEPLIAAAERRLQLARDVPIRGAGASVRVREAQLVAVAHCTGAV